MQGAALRQPLLTGSAQVLAGSGPSVGSGVLLAFEVEERIVLAVQRGPGGPDRACVEAGTKRPGSANLLPG